MGVDTMFRFLTGVAAAVLMLAATSDQAQSGSAKRSGTVHIEQVQIALLISANLGGGTLTYKGKTHKFSIGGIGVGGFGGSRIIADGFVYDLKKLSDFEGTYVQGRYGAAFGEQSTGKLYMKNGRNVYIELDAKREGLALSAGADGIVIQFD